MARMAPPSATRREQRAGQELEGLVGEEVLDEPLDLLDVARPVGDVPEDDAGHQADDVAAQVEEEADLQHGPRVDVAHDAAHLAGPEPVDVLALPAGHHLLGGDQPTRRGGVRLRLRGRRGGRRRRRRAGGRVGGRGRRGLGGLGHRLGRLGPGGSRAGTARRPHGGRPGRLDALGPRLLLAFGSRLGHGGVGGHASKSTGSTCTDRGHRPVRSTTSASCEAVSASTLTPHADAATSGIGCPSTASARSSAATSAGLGPPASARGGDGRRGRRHRRPAHPDLHGGTRPRRHDVHDHPAVAGRRFGGGVGRGGRLDERSRERGGVGGGAGSAPLDGGDGHLDHHEGGAGRQEQDHHEQGDGLAPAPSSGQVSDTAAPMGTRCARGAPGAPSRAGAACRR